MLRVLVTGATGFIGRYLCKVLQERGHSIKILVRRGESYKNFPVTLDNVIAVDWPYGINDSIAQGIDLIIHCANSAEVRNYQVAYDSNVLSTKLLCHAAEQNGSGFIYISSQSANKDVDSFYSRTKLASEDIVKKLKSHWTIIRPGMVYGASSKGLFARMQWVVNHFKIVPLIDGGQQIVQPIHVQDLTKAITDIGEKIVKHSKKIYLLAQPDPTTLRHFLDISSEKHNWYVNVPSRLILPFVKFFSKYVSLPINESNIKGLINIKKMDSNESLIALNLRLRELNKENIKRELDFSNFQSLKGILIGSGKMGTVHFQNIKEFPQVNLVGIVEKDKKKAGILKGFGAKLPVFSSTAHAITQTNPDFAIICTPTFTHQEIIQECVNHGVHCFVEKPLSTSISSNDMIKKNALAHSKIKISVGYFTSYFSHLTELKDNLNGHKFGKVKKVEAQYLLSHVMEKGKHGWETNKNLSGGGVVLNAGVHTINTLCELFGTSVKVLSKSKKMINSSDVEDELIAQTLFGKTPVSLRFNWSIPGHNTALNTINIQTTKGEIILDNIGYIFKNKHTIKSFRFSDDPNISFNLSPESGASGYLSEMQEFIDSLIFNKPSKTDISWASKVERIAHELAS